VQVSVIICLFIKIVTRWLRLSRESRQTVYRPTYHTLAR